MTPNKLHSFPFGIPFFENVKITFHPFGSFCPAHGHGFYHFNPYIAKISEKLPGNFFLFSNAFFRKCKCQVFHHQFSSVAYHIINDEKNYIAYQVHYPKRQQGKQIEKKVQQVIHRKKMMNLQSLTFYFYYDLSRAIPE